MPTPHGTRGGMAFSADELRVLRRALAETLATASDASGSAHRPRTDDRHGQRGWPVREYGERREYREYLRLAESVEEAVGEAARLRAFLLADLALCRTALPGAASAYLERLAEALDAGHLPAPDDFAALRSLCRTPCGPAEARRRDGIRRRCEALAAVGARLEGRIPRTRPQAALTCVPAGAATASVHASVRASGPARKPAREPARKPGRTAPKPEPDEKPVENPKTGAPTAPGAPPKREPEPGHRVPTPAEIFPPKRRPAPSPPPPAPKTPDEHRAPEERRAAG